jgi:hypothetical protein
MTSTKVIIADINNKSLRYNNVDGVKGVVTIYDGKVMVDTKVYIKDGDQITFNNLLNTVSDKSTVSILWDLLYTIGHVDVVEVKTVGDNIKVSKVIDDGKEVNSDDHTFKDSIKDKNTDTTMEMLPFVNPAVTPNPKIGNITYRFLYADVSKETKPDNAIYANKGFWIPIEKETTPEKTIEPKQEVVLKDDMKIESKTTREKTTEPKQENVIGDVVEVEMATIPKEKEVIPNPPHVTKSRKDTVKELIDKEYKDESDYITIVIGCDGSSTIYK